MAGLEISQNRIWIPFQGNWIISSSWAIFLDCLFFLASHIAPLTIAPMAPICTPKGPFIYYVSTFSDVCKHKYSTKSKQKLSFSDLLLLTYILEWPHLNSWAKLSLVMDKQGQRSMKTALKFPSILVWFGIERQYLGAFLENKEH